MPWVVGRPKTALPVMSQTKRKNVKQLQELGLSYLETNLSDQRGWIDGYVEMAEPLKRKRSGKQG